MKPKIFFGNNLNLIMQNISFQNIEMIFQPNISETALINIDSNFLQLQVTFKYIMKYKLYLF